MHTESATEATVKPVNLFQELIDDLMAEIRGYLEAAKAKLDLEREQKTQGVMLTFAYRPVDTVMNWRDRPDITTTKYGFASQYETDVVAIMKENSESTTTENCTAKTKALSARTLREIGQIQRELTKGEGWAGKYDAWLNINQSTLQLMSEQEYVAALSIVLGFQKIRFAIEAAEQKRDSQAKAAAEYTGALKKIEEARAVKAKKDAKADAESQLADHKSVETASLVDVPVNNEDEAEAEEVLPPKVDAPAELSAEELKSNSYKKHLANLLEFLFRTIYALQVDAAKTVQSKLSHSREVPKEVAVPMMELLAKKIADINATQAMFAESEQRFANVAAHTAELLGEIGKMHDSLRSWVLPSVVSYNMFLQKFTGDLQQFDTAIREMAPTAKKGSKFGLGLQ